jgi:hypothetical protein
VELSQSTDVENRNAEKLSVATGLLIEPMEDGAALVFDQSTGATTLVNCRALAFLELLCHSGVVSELALSSLENQAFSSASDFSEILISLEKSKLVIRY